MKTIRVKKEIKKEIDYSYLEEFYTKINIDGIDFNTNLDNLKDVGNGALLLKEMIDNKKHICIVSDYDADGITSAVTLTKGIKNILKNKNTSTIVNKRKDSNGFNKKLIRRIIDLHEDSPIDLIITSDHGSNDNDAFLLLKEKCNNVKIILTDHHTISKYPECVEVFINPMREDSMYPKSISGCATAFLLLVKTFELKKLNHKALYELVPYAGISTVTDCMDMNLPYNQFLVEMALRIMNSERYVYWHIFKIKLGIGILYTIKDFGFTLGPLFNCGNVVNEEEHIFKMLMENDVDKLATHISVGIQLNKKRKDLTKKYVDILKETMEPKNTICELVDVKEDVIINGKIASAIGTTYNLPTIIFGPSKTDVYNGSGRGIVSNFNILDVIHKINKHDNSIINTYGGHYGALGCSVYKNKFNDFKTLFDVYSKESMPTDSNVIDCDMYVMYKYIDIKLYEEQEKYGPYGQYKPAPTYMTIMTIERVHSFGPIAKFVLSHNGVKIDAIYFFNDTSVTKDNLDSFKGKLCFIAFNLELARYRGSYSLNLLIKRVEEVKK